jgi:hypothetical protein
MPGERSIEFTTLAVGSVATPRIQRFEVCPFRATKKYGSSKAGALWNWVARAIFLVHESPPKHCDYSNLESCPRNSVPPHLIRAAESFIKIALDLKVDSVVFLLCPRKCSWLLQNTQISLKVRANYGGEIKLT